MKTDDEATGTQHTATPWTFDADGEFSADLFVSGPEGEPILSGALEGLDEDEIVANVDFMQCAVNCHYDLLIALRQFGRHAYSCNFHQYEPGVVKTVEDDCDCGLTAALKKAEGKE